MKKIIVPLLLALLNLNFVYAQSSDDFAIVRFNLLHVDEISYFNEDDSGEGITAEFAFFIQANDKLFQTLGLEIGYIDSEVKVITNEIDVELVPYFVNYTIGGNFGEYGIIWEAGIGLGGISIEADDGFESGDDFVIGGQLFGSIGYEFIDGLSLSLGLRYMTSDEANASVDEDSALSGDERILDSIAADVSLSFAF